MHAAYIKHIKGVCQREKNQRNQLPYVVFDMVAVVGVAADGTHLIAMHSDKNEQALI